MSEESAVPSRCDGEAAAWFEEYAYLHGTGAVLDLMGRNQAIGVLNSVNPLPGNGGMVGEASVILMDDDLAQPILDVFLQRRQLLVQPESQQ